MIDYNSLTIEELKELSKEYIFIICDGHIIGAKRKDEK